MGLPKRVVVAAVAAWWRWERGVCGDLVGVIVLVGMPIEGGCVKDDMLGLL